MRIWIGAEQEEKNTSPETLFICTNYFGSAEACRVLELVEDLEPEGVYLGAGRQDTEFDTKQFEKVCKSLNKANVMLTIEVSYLNILENIVHIINEFCVKVVYRTELTFDNNMLKNIFIKLDDFSEIAICKFERDIVVDVTTVENGLYSNIDRHIQ